MNHEMLLIIYALNELILLIKALCMFLNVNISYLVFKVILVSKIPISNKNNNDAYDVPT